MARTPVSSEVVEQLPVSEVNVTVGCRGRNGGGKTIDDLRKREVVFHDVSRCATRRVGESTSTIYHTWRAAAKSLTMIGVAMSFTALPASK
jgi:hypothetical protein